MPSVDPNVPTPHPRPGKLGPARPPAGRTLLRGLRRRCPGCGRGRLTRRWFWVQEACPSCGLRVERTEGHWIGAIGINTIVTFTLLFFSLAAGAALSYPDIAVGPLIAACLVVAVVFPTFFYPVSRIVWLAIDVVMRPLEPGEAGYDAD